MTAEEIHRILDDAGLAPPVHYCALPHDWRTALEAIEAQIEEEMEQALGELEDELTAGEDW